MVSQCVTNDTVVQLSCPVVGFDENYDYINWFYETELEYDYENAEFSARRPINKERGYETEEITCRYGEEQAEDEQIYNVMIVITGKTKTLSTANVYHFFYLARCS